MSKPNVPMSRSVMAGRPRPKFNPDTLKRVLKMLFKSYPVLMPVTIACIIFSAIINTMPAIFNQQIIALIEEWYISRDWVSAKPLIMPKIITLGCLYGISLISFFTHTQLMAYITQGFLSKARKNMFSGMQNLPISYFDTHKHGDIMSHYTNDIDTLRQLVSQAIPAVLQAGLIVISIFFIMIWYSVWMTLVVVGGVFLLFLVTKTVGGGSAKYFIRQQKSVGKAEGFIQEMMNGQKVIKVFCHEKNSQKDFDEINNALYEDSLKAHSYANLLGPINMNIGNILYVVIATIGGLFLLSEGFTNISLSKALGREVVFGISVVIPFLNMTRQFTGNVNQVSQQINSVVMGLAGAERILNLMDAEPEVDDGYVTLVNANIDKKGNITETDKRTGKWAWKHPHGDGTVSFTELKGDVRLLMLILVTHPIRWCFIISISMPSPVKRWHLLAPRVPEKPPSQTCLTAFMILPTAKSVMTA